MRTRRTTSLAYGERSFWEICVVASLAKADVHMTSGYAIQTADQCLEAWRERFGKEELARTDSKVPAIGDYVCHACGRPALSGRPCVCGSYAIRLARTDSKVSPDSKEEGNKE